MKLKLLSLIFILTLFSTVAFCGKIAVIYSAYANKGLQHSCDSFIYDAGYEPAWFENTEIDKLASSINDYDMIMTTSVYNYVNTQDFTKYANVFNSYVSNGGILVLCDLNYPSSYEWIPSAFPGLYMEAGKEPHNKDGEIGRIYNLHHPIFKNVSEIFMPWSYAYKVSPEFDEVLSVGLDNSPITVYKRIGKGILVCSTSYAQQKFPNSNVIKNLIDFKGTENTNIKAQDVPVSNKPGKTYKLNKVYGKDVETNWTVSKNDYGLHFNFVCFDDDTINTTNTKLRRDEKAFNDDSIEICIKPNYENSDVYHFAISENNIIYDAKNFDPSYDAYIDSNIKVEKDKWTLDVFIPYSSIGVNKSTVLDKEAPFSFNIARVYHPKQESSLYVWGDRKIVRTDLYGKLLFDTPVKTAKFIYNEPIEIKVPEKVLTNDNIFKINKTCKYKIHDFTSHKTYDGKANGCLIDFDKSGEHILMAVALDGMGNVIGSSNIVQVRATDVLNFKVLYPYYRDIVQSKDPDKTMDIVCSLNNYTGISPMIDYVIKSKDKVLKQDTLPISNEEIHITYDLSKLEPGEYSYSVKLIDNKKNIRSFDKKFKVLEPADYEVTFDRKKICYVNGEAFFPIGLCHVGEWAVTWLNKNKNKDLPELTVESVNEEVAKQGFNLAMTQSKTWPMTDYIANLAKDRGMIYNYELGDCKDKNRLAELRDAYNRLGTGLFYYTIDEPINERLESAIQIYSILKEVDPHRPIGAAVCFPKVFYDAVNAFDIMMPDTYLFVNYAQPSIAELLGPLNAAKEACNDQKPIWAVPQLFGWGGDKPGFTKPTPEDVRCQMYFYLVYGVTGFCWYGYTSPELDSTNPYGMWHLPSSELWEPIKVLNAEMKEFAPIIIKGDRVGPLKCNNSKIHSNVWKCDGKNYAIIVNPERESLTGTFEELKGDVKPFFSKDSYNFNNGTITLKPLECIIVVY